MPDAPVFTPWTTPHDRSRLVIRMAAAMVSLFAIAFAALWIFAHGPYVSDRPFDAEKWAAAKPISDDTRWRMRDDLRDHYLRAGMSLGEVTELLGPGEPGTTVKTYPLRNRGYLDPQYDRLVITFDDKGQLVSTSIESARSD